MCFEDWWIYALWIIGAYLYGALPVVYLIGRLRGVDLSKEEDMHISLWRNVGRIEGLMGVTWDVAKGGIAVAIVDRVLRSRAGSGGRSGTGGDHGGNVAGIPGLQGGEGQYHRSGHGSSTGLPSPAFPNHTHSDRGPGKNIAQALWTQDGRSMNA